MNIAITQDRTKFLGGTDAMRIMAGDWQTLWQEKTGKVEADDLTKIFRVQLGIYTENFHAMWIATTQDMDLSAYQPVFHKEHTMLRAAADRWWTSKGTFLDLKHSHAGASPRSITETYLPQMAHYMLVHDVRHCFVSTIPGNDDPFLTEIRVPDAYIDHLLEMELRFWWHVEREIMPDIAPSAELRRIAKEAESTVLVNAMRYVDMTGNNQWADLAADLRGSRAAHALHEKCKVDLKAMIEADVSEASGHGITIKRDKRGALRINMED
jgi:predicted phage-related endonuclease